MADDWLGINSSHLLPGGAGVGFCGESIGHTLAEALDGDDYWDHMVDEVHWFILDLGQTYTIKKVRGRSEYAGKDPTDVDIFVSDDTENWGAAVASGINTWQDTSVWQEVDTTDKDGRYIKVVINATEYYYDYIGWGKEVSPFPIFDAYGCPLMVTHEWEGSDGIAVGEALVKSPIKVLSDGMALSDVLIKNPIKTLVDAIAFTDAWEGYKLSAKVFTDGIAVGEALIKSTSKVVSDGIAVGEALLKSTTKVLSDGIAIGEELVKWITGRYEMVFTDGIAIGEVLRKDIAKTFTDAIAFTDVVTRFFEMVFTDGIKIGELLLKWRWLAPVRRLLPKRLLQPKREEEANE